MEATAERKQQTRTISNYPPDISESLAASDSCNCCLSNYNYLQHSIPCRICILVSSIWHGKVGSRIAVALCYAFDPQHLYLGCNVFSHDHVAAPYKYIWCSTIGLSRGFHSKVHLFINPNKFLIYYESFHYLLNYLLFGTVNIIVYKYCIIYTS